MTQIVLASEPATIEMVRGLFEEYWQSFGFTPCFQGFDREVEALPGEYVPPGGGLAVALVDGDAAGCAALRRFDAERCEAKRLYVRPAFRGQGVGRDLLRWAVEAARAAGYLEMVGDTMPVMKQALEMYDRMGFERTAAYAEHPTEGAIYLRLRL